MPNDHEVAARGSGSILWQENVNDIVETAPFGMGTQIF
jgi:hypothetical protein